MRSALDPEVGLRVIAIRTEGLGNSSYLLTHNGIGILVDLQRDIDRFERLIEAEDIEPRLVLETHLHNDYVSGGPALSKKTGAELVVPAAAAPVYGHRSAFHREDIELGDLVIRPLHTPGHTPEHTSYLVLIEGVEHAVFTGGSLLVGSAGRTDLAGPERAESLTRLQYRSVNRLARLPGQVDLYPTHGEGSFCTTSATPTETTSTIGAERRSNPVLVHQDEEAFTKAQLNALPRYPSYYRHMGRANLVMNEEFNPRRLPVLEPQDLKDMSDEMTIVDARPRSDVAAGHIPGSVAVELGPSFGTWVGWLCPFEGPLVLVANPDQDLDDAQRQLGRIGFDDIRGVIRDPSDAELISYRTASLTEFAAAVNVGAQILDVRAPEEWEHGYMDGSTLRYLPDLVHDRSGFVPGEEVWVACASGYRASIAGSLLTAHGFDPVVLVHGGVADVMSRIMRTQSMKLHEAQMAMTRLSNGPLTEPRDRPETRAVSVDDANGPLPSDRR